MKRTHLLLAFSGWLAFFFLAFCTSTGVSVDVTLGDRGFAAVDAAEGNGGVTGTPRVVDAEGRLVGALVSRTHLHYDGSELYDAVQVYNPGTGLFFTIRMSNSEVLLPAKVLFSKGNCNGEAAIRATCPDCVSGYDLAFARKGAWYRIEGGTERVQFGYSSYLPPEPGSACAGHGMSTSYGYPVVKLDASESPGDFSPPLRFAW